MAETSKLTNILLAIIAVCLIVIAIKPAGVVPEAAAQVRERDVSSRDRFAGITATQDGQYKAAMEQVAATKEVAAALDNLAKSTADIATAIEGVGNKMGQGSGSVGSPVRSGGSTPTPIVVR